MTSSFATLRRFAPLPKRVSPAQPLERCELCNAALPPLHRHLLEMETRKVACSCDSCALLFHKPEAARFKLIPRDIRALLDFQMTDVDWEGLALPIEMAFFFHSTPAKKMVALYPSPAGATESLLTLTAWDALVEKNAVLGALIPDVEALLVNRIGTTREYFIAPMDICYELVGTIRIHWRGLHGGEEVWEKIGHFFSKLKECAQPSVNEPHA